MAGHIGVMLMRLATGQRGTRWGCTKCVVEMHEEECLSSGLVDSPLSDCWVTETERSSHRHVSAARHPNKYNISAASIENRIKMEQSWQLWREFLEDYSRFKDWIQQAEAIAKEPHSSLALYTETKAELQRFECLRKRTEEQAIRLESINRRYRRLAKEQGLGLATQLKGMMHDGNQRWDNLQRRVSIICKRLKYFVSQREEFEVARENLWLQLMELDLRRNKLEYLSKDEVTERINRQQVFQQMISSISEKMDELLMAALNLLQKSEPQDAVTIEEEVWELLQFQLDVFGQVFEWELATRGASESDHHSDIIPEGQGVERRGGLLTQHPLGDPQPGHWSPFGANSLPLEWDSSVDIGGSRTYEGSVSVPCSVPDQFIDLYKGRTWGSRRVRPARRRVKADFRKVKQVDVACQCDSEINLIPGDPGPLFIEKQVVSDRFPQGICCPDDTNGFWEKQREHQNPAGLANHGGLHQGGGKPWPSLPPAVSSDEQSLAEKLRNTNGHCWMWQRFDWERTRDQNGRVHSDWLQGQTLGPRGQARCMEQWLQMLEMQDSSNKLQPQQPGFPPLGDGAESLLGQSMADSKPKPKRCDTGAGLGVTAGTDRLLHPPSVLLEGTVPPQSSSQYLLVAIALSLILLLLFFLFFLLPAVIQECDWHRKNTFLPFHFTLTYPNGPPPT